MRILLLLLLTTLTGWSASFTGNHFGNAAGVSNVPLSGLSSTGALEIVKATGIGSALLPTNNIFVPVTTWRRVTPIDPNFVLKDWNFNNPDSSGWRQVQTGTNGVNPDPQRIDNGVWAPLAIPNARQYIAKSPMLQLAFGTVVFDVAEAPAGQLFLGWHASPTATPTWGVESHMLAYYDNVAHTASFYGTGLANGMSQSNTPTLIAPFSLAFQFGMNHQSLWARPSGGSWICLTRTTNTANWKIPSVVETLRPAFEAIGAWKFSRIYAGYPGEVGSANQSFITYDDGTPVTKDGNYYFIGNGNIANGGDISGSVSLGDAARSSCLTVYRLKLPIGEIDTVCKINTLRTNELKGENSGKCIFDRSMNTWYWLLPTWSNGEGYNGSTKPVRTMLYKTQDDPFLNKSLILSNGVVMPFATWFSTNLSQYDPDAVKIGNTWFAAWAQNNVVGDDSFPALASGPSIDGPWTMINCDSNHPAWAAPRHVEGSKFQKIGGNWYGLWGDYHTASSTALMHVYDLGGAVPTTMNYIGTNRFSFLLQTTLAIHPASVMHAMGGKTYWYMLMFNTAKNQNMSLSFGDVMIQRSATAENGREFPIYQSRW